LLSSPAKNEDLAVTVPLLIVCRSLLLPEDGASAAGERARTEVSTNEGTKSATERRSRCSEVEGHGNLLVDEERN
jgi:hypothetical protein